MIPNFSDYGLFRRKSRSVLYPAQVALGSVLNEKRSPADVRLKAALT